MRIIKSTHPQIITVLTSRVEPTAKLPLSAIRGTEKERYNLAGKFASQLRDGLDKVSDTSECKVSDFLGLINNIITPHKINLEVKQLKRDFNLFHVTGGSINVSADYTNKLSPIGNIVFDTTHKSMKGYQINLPLTKDNTVIKDKFSAFHEARHFFDSICNPKTIDTRSLKVLDDEVKSEAFFNTYKTLISDMNLFSGTKSLKKKVQKNLAKLSDDEAIDCLQMIRHSLQTEINAYKDAGDYMHKHYSSNFFQISGCNEFMLTHDYPERLKLTNEMLSERLKSARESYKQKLERPSSQIHNVHHPKQRP